MPIPLPSLDDRRWSDLVDEARSLIPRFDPEWTDFNPSNLGVTLLELIAWRVEGDIYRLNRIPHAFRRKFLALVGRLPRPAVPARLVVGLAAAPGTGLVPAETEFHATALDGSTCVFRAPHGLDPVLPALTAVRVGPPGASPVDRTSDLLRSGRLVALGDDPVVGSALWLGFDEPLPADVPLRLHLTFLSGRSGPDERWRILDEQEARELACRRPGVPDSTTCASSFPAGRASLPAPSPSPMGGQGRPPHQLSLSRHGGTETVLRHHDARMVWEISAGPTDWTTLDPAADQVCDQTRAFSLDGPVTFRLPSTSMERDGRHWLRARIASGTHDTAPVIGRVAVNALDLGQSAAAVGRFVVAPGALITGTPGNYPRRARLSLGLDAHGAIIRLDFDGDPAAPEFEVLGYRPPAPGRGLLVIDAVRLGASDGTIGQEFALPGAPVAGDTLEVWTLDPPATSTDPGAWQAWTLRPDLDAAGPADRIATADMTAGLLLFGDGGRGRIPTPGATVLAQFRTTVGAEGDIRAGAIAGLAPSLGNWLRFDARISDAGQRFAATGIEPLLAASGATAWRDLAPVGYGAIAAAFGQTAVSQPVAAAGGADAEDIDTAAGAAVADLATPGRAVTAADFRRLALDVPGTALARVEVIAGRHPSLPGLKAPGCVTVIVVPDRHSARPLPSPGLLAAVRHFLDRRRVMGTYVAVAGPTYRTVTVVAEVRSSAGARPARVLADVTAALNTFLDPLRGGPAVLAASEAPSAPGTTSRAVTSLSGAVTVVGPSAASPIPGVQLATAARTTVPPPPVEPPPPPGWPFGRQVYRAEVLQLIQSVAGVDHVHSLELSDDGATPVCGDLCVGPFQLVTPGVHRVVIH
jgi:hypothetical protein